MNDYVAGNLARERQADYLREIARDELVAQARGATATAGPRAGRGPLAQRAPLRIGAVIRRVVVALTSGVGG